MGYRVRFPTGCSLFVLLASFGCAQATMLEPGPEDEGAGNGGKVDDPDLDSGSSGGMSSGGTGGQMSSGGIDAADGGSGTTPSDGGATPSGGAPADGGASADGGSPAAGGAPGSGGASTSGLPRQLEAEDATLVGCASEPGGDGGKKVVGLDENALVTFPAQDLSSLTHIAFHVGTPYANGQVEVRQDTETGTLLGTLTVESATGGWSSPDLVTVTLALETLPTGLHDLVLVPLYRPEGWVVSLDYIELRDEP